MFAETVGRACAWMRDKTASGLVRLHVSPSLLTLVGLAASAWAGVWLAQGRFIPAAWVLVAAGFCDTLDGVVARLGNRQTSFGAFLDSTVDRYSDFAVFVGICVHFALDGHNVTALLALAVLVGAYMTSYCRARAECLIKSCKAGFLERPERIVLIICALFLNHLVSALWVLAIMANWTALVRIAYTFGILNPREPSTNRFAAALRRTIIWDYPRASIPYDVMVVITLGFTALTAIPAC